MKKRTATKPKKRNFALSAPEAKQVKVTGDFLSWDENGILLKRKKSGLWQTGIPLQPGRHEYKFIVDGQWWTDPSNDNIVTNSFGAQNSVIEI